MTAVWSLLVFLVAGALCQNEQRETTCGLPDGLHVPLSCSSSQWIRVMSEEYSRAPTDGTCTLTSDCRYALSSVRSGLDVSCNREVGESGVCQEPTEALRWIGDCVNSSESVAVQVRYECIPGIDIVDMCSNKTRTWTPIFSGLWLKAYLATPDFPNTPALSQHCTCNITGQNLWIQGLEVKADVGNTAPWLDVLTVAANDTDQWSMQHSGGGQVRYLQEPMLIPVDNVPFDEASVSYQDFNLPGQLAWLRVQGEGDNLTVSCSSESVPPPPTTTTTTTTTTPTTTTATTTTTSTPTPNTSTRKLTTVPTSTTTRTSTSSSPTIPTSTSERGSAGGGDSSGRTSFTPPTSSTARVRPPTTSTTSPRKAPKKDEKDSDDTGVVVGLCVLVIVLVALALLLGFIIYRRYQRAKKSGQLEAGGGGFSAFLGLNYWYSRQHHHRHDNDPTLVDIPVHDFHNLEGIGQDIGAEGRDNGQYETIRDLDLRLQTSGGEPGNGGKPRKDNSAHVGTAGHERNGLRPMSVEVPSSDLAATAPSPLPGMGDGSRSLSDTAGQRGLTSKQEQFVTRVLDDTLVSIASQRQALTGKPPSPTSQEDADAKQSKRLPLPTESNKGGNIYAEPWNTSPLPKDNGDGSDIYAEPQKSSPIPKDSGEGSDIYAKPIKHSPVPKDSGEGSDIYAKPIKQSPVPKDNGEVSDIYAKPQKRPVSKESIKEESSGSEYDVNDDIGLWHDAESAV